MSEHPLGTGREDHSRSLEDMQEFKSQLRELARRGRLHTMVGAQRQHDAEYASKLTVMAWTEPDGQAAYLVVTPVQDEDGSLGVSARLYTGPSQEDVQLQAAGLRPVRTRE